MACETASSSNCGANSGTVDTGPSHMETGAVEGRGELGHALPVARSWLRHGAAVSLNDVVVGSRASPRRLNSATLMATRSSSDRSSMGVPRCRPMAIRKVGLARCHVVERLVT